MLRVITEKKLYARCIFLSKKFSDEKDAVNMSESRVYGFENNLARKQC